MLCNFNHQIEQREQEQAYSRLSNPLDFLEEENEQQLIMQRRPRSSNESSDRQIEIPACQPAYISRHLREGKRIYDPIDSFSPQPVLRKPLFKLGSFMENDTFDEDVDFLFKDLQRTPKDRLCCDTNFSSVQPDDSCFSSFSQREF